VLQDIATLTGGQMLSEAPFRPFGSIRLADLGRARWVVSSRDNTTIVGGGCTPAILQARINQVTAAIEAATSDDERRKLGDRLAWLTRGVAVIRVGGATEADLIQNKARVERASPTLGALTNHGALAFGQTSFEAGAIEAWLTRNVRL
jgi:chaperonin GroEL